jgi:hypothetical protein
MVLMHFESKSAFAQKTHLLLNDERVVATRIDLSPGEAYALSEDQGRSVWTALDPVVFTTSKGSQRSRKQVPAGEAAMLNAGEHVEFRAENGSPASLVLVEPKMTKQDLTVGPFILNGSLEDASGRNATLLVAVSSCRFRDIRNLGNESEWVPSKPDIVVMKAGTVRWIRPGIHHFKNLSAAPAKLVSIEW